MEEQSKVKRLDYKERQFVANGNEYTILESIPLSRYIEYQKLVPKLAFGVTFIEIFNNLKKAYELQNTGKRYADVAVIIHNILNGIKEIEDNTRHDAALQICALIIVRKGEEVGKIDKDLMNDKINDWALEGYEINGFFHLALTSIEGFRETFKEYILKQSQPES